MLRFKTGAEVRQLTDADAVWRELHAHVRGAFIHFLVHQKRDVLDILREWISASGGDDPTAWAIRARLGQQRHILEFDDWQNMARALFGEFLGRMALEDENELAAATVQSAYIRAHLGALLERLRGKLLQPATPAALKTLLDEKADFSSLEYQPLYRKKSAHIAKVLKNPDAYFLQDHVVTLHDMSSYFKKHAKGLVQASAAQSTGTFFRIDERGEVSYSRRPIEDTSDFRHKGSEGNPNYTLKENSGFVMAARVQGMPIWAGPSFTTARMMKMAEWAAARPEEFEALAWALFAFWNQCYPTTSTWIHRFHEVMDMAHNWGVPFEAFGYPRGVPPARGMRPKV